MNFEFATAGRILFGRHATEGAVTDIRKMGRRALVLTGRTVARAEVLTELLRSDEFSFETFAVEREPTLEIVDEACARGREFRADMVIAFGGGSVIDTGKATAALLTNPGEILDFLEVVGRGRSLTKPSLPLVAVPTTAGTGAEVTRNAVIGVPSRKVKVSMRSPYMLPDLAVIDPRLTVAMSPRTTAAVGLDALTQVIEPFLSNLSNPLTDALCKEGMTRAARSLRRAFQDGADLDAREDMCLTSLFSGLALANAKLGAVHGFAGPLGGMFDAPHGEICGILLPHVLKALTDALKERGTSDTAIGRLDIVAQILTGDPGAHAADGVLWVRQLTADLGLPGLEAFGISRSDFSVVVRQAEAASSMKGSPVVFTADELTRILENALSA